MLDLTSHYWPRYCEENVWHLCAALPPGIDDAHALFVTGRAGRVAMWHQRAAGHPDSPVAWDYHVVLLGRVDGEWQIWDADSDLTSPCPARHYLDASFRALPPRHAGLRPRFRLVEAETYHRALRSDRSHMRRADGSWHSPPPPGNPIGSGTNLMRFLDGDADFLGRVCDLSALLGWLAVRSAPHRS